MRKKTIDRGIVTLLIFTLLTVLTWAGFEVYRAYTKVSIPEVSTYLEVLNPNLDTQVLTELETRSP